MDIFSVITLLGGLAMFLYGMEVMGDGLKNASGSALKQVLGKATQNLILGVITGMLVTAVIQSSTATIVLTVGLISANILDLKQAVSIVMGANIGTTVTAQIIRLMDIESGGSLLMDFFKPSTLAPLALIVGVVLIMFVKSNKSMATGEIFAGFGILFSGLLNMTAAVTPLSESQAFLDLMQRFSNYPLIAILLGLVMTVIVQSSSAMVGMIQALSVTGAMTFNLVYPLIMGINLGTCVTTALVCSIGSSKDAKRVGIVHIAFNVIGTILFMIVMTIIFDDNTLLFPVLVAFKVFPTDLALLVRTELNSHVEQRSRQPIAAISFRKTRQQVFSSLHGRARPVLDVLADVEESSAAIDVGDSLCEGVDGVNRGELIISRHEPTGRFWNQCVPPAELHCKFHEAEP